MSIGIIISEKRKKLGLSQKKLGELLGVSNQAVSKWENGTIAPDIYLLPQIAATLKITLNELFGIEDQKKVSQKTTADTYPKAAFDDLHLSFYQASRCRFSPGGKTDDEELNYQRECLKKGDMLGCISNTHGAVVIRDEFAFIDTSFKDGDIGRFCTAECGNILKALSDPSVRKIVCYLYTEGFKRNKASQTKFYLSEIMESCGLPEYTVVGAICALSSADIVTSFSDDEDEKMPVSCQVSFSKMLYAAEIFRLASMIFEGDSWLVVRDSSMFKDYSFESCADQK
jgi:transcriptional regulator with XRE-family HTH domain